MQGDRTLYRYHAQEILSSIFSFDLSLVSLTS